MDTNTNQSQEKPFTHLHTVFHKHKFTGLALIGGAFFIYLALALAAQTPTSATLNGGSSVTVQGGASITAHVFGTLTGTSTWRGTKWRISTTAPGSTTCANTTDYTSTGTGLDSGAFTVTAPSSSGTYNAYFVMDSANACNGTSSGNLTMTGAVVVDATDPTFTIQYYADSGLTTSLGNNPHLKAGTYYMKITSSEALSGTPTISIAAQGTANDVTNAATTLVSGNDYTYTRVISSDGAATGSTLENISVSGTDAVGNSATNVNPTNEATKAAYTDTIASTVSGVSSTSANGTYGFGSVIPVTVTFNESVNVTGTPQLTLATGSPASTVLDYTSGTGTATLTFNYTVAAGNTSADLDYDATTSLALNGGTIQDLAGNTATLTLASPGAAGSLAANKALVIDSNIHNASTFADDAAIGTIAWTSTSNAQTSNDAYATLTSSTANQVTHYLKATGFGYSIPAGMSITGIQVDVERSESGSTLRVSDNSVRLVKQGTIVGDNKSTGTNWPGSDGYITYGGSSDLWGTTWSVDDINSATTGFVISAKHDSSTSSRDFNVDHIRMRVYYSLDTTAPTLSPVSIASNNTNTSRAKAGDTVTVSFTSNESIQTPTVTIGGSAAAVAGGPTVWTASRPMTGSDTEGLVPFTIDFTDLAGNPGTQVTSVTNGSSVTFDQTAPTILSLTSTASPGPTNTSPIPMTVTFDEAVTGLAEGDFVVGNGSVDALSLAGGPTVYTFTVTPSAPPGPSTVTVDLGATTVKDLAGNDNTSPVAQFSIVFDSANPTVTLTSAGTTDPTNVSPIPMKATFSQAVTGFYDVGTDIAVGNGSVTSFTPDLVTAPVGSVYDFEVTPAGQGNVTVDVGAGVAQDAATNANLAATQFSVTYDTVAPSVTAADMYDTDNDGKVDQLQLTFDEALADTASGSNGFDVSSVSDHGLCTGETADPDGTATLVIDFTCDTIATHVGDLTLDLTSNAGVEDAAGNQVGSVTLNSASVPPVADFAQPVVVSTTPADGAAGANVSAAVVVNFSEPMNTGSFTISDDDTNTYTGTVWSNGDTTATSTHNDWTFTVTVNALTDASDLAALSVNGAGTYAWSFDTGADQYLGRTSPALPTTNLFTDTGLDLSNGVSTAAGGNILINNVSTPLNSVTTGDLSGEDFTGPQLVGDQSVLPVTAVQLQSTGDLTLQNAALSNVSLNIPNNTTLFGCAGWDGMLHLQSGSNTGTAPSGFSVGGDVYEVGSVSCPLLLDQPATIVLTGVTGSTAYKPAGSTNWFPVPTCAGTYAAPTPPPAPVSFQDCAISDGTDTKILTYHFTAFGPLVSSGISSGPSTGGSGAPAFILTQKGSETSEKKGSESTALETLHGAATTSPAVTPEAVPTCGQGSSVLPFTDVSSANEASVLELYRKCAMTGKTRTLFAPNDPVTRAELAKVLLAYNDLGVQNYVDRYADVGQDDWFAPYMLRAVELGIVPMQSMNHQNSVLLRPNDKLTRAEAIAMVLKAAGVDVSSYDQEAVFVDVSPYDWFAKVAAYAQNNKLIVGYQNKFVKGGRVSKFYSFPRLLGPGNVGEDVKNLKMIMMQMDYYTGVIDTNYDAALSKAVLAYQQAYKFENTGTFGPVTRSKLLKEYLHTKTSAFFRPYDLITRGDVAKFISKVNAQKTGKVLGVSTSRAVQGFTSELVSVLVHFLMFR